MLLEDPREFDQCRAITSGNTSPLRAVDHDNLRVLVVLFDSPRTIPPGDSSCRIIDQRDVDPRGTRKRDANRTRTQREFVVLENGATSELVNDRPDLAALYFNRPGVSGGFPGRPRIHDGRSWHRWLLR